ncbi:S8 family serine peptidase [Streptomyces mirabilis]|uniref:S8 family serine peptidase n=1 Tax=Streptomyces mirabilis TaxID=68239 RepID=UPI003324A7AF
MTHLPSGRRRRLLVVAAALLVTAATPHVASSADTSPANSPAGATRTADNVAASVVTLVTGDKVTVAPGVGDGPGTITVQGPDGEPTGARVLTVGGDTYVYPDSARPYLASGTLDDRLFDISRLVADGYDDAALKHLPLIVTYGGKEASASTLRSRAVALPGDVTDVHPLTSVNGVALAADREDTDALWSALTGTDSDSDSAKVPDADAAFHGGVAKVWLDGRAEATRMSLGSSENADGDTVLARAVNELSAETGALFTIAAGNDGPGARTVRSPGTADAALTVGAVDSSDALADFSSRGPRYGDDALKPEITAPGVGILAARSQYIATGSGYYMTASGTSMATPHVAGVAALVAAAHPDWTGSRIKDALVSTAEPTLDISADDGGNGRVDAAAATATLTATGKIDAGIHSPGTDKGTVHSTAAWTNTGDHAVAVDLAVDAPGVPDSVFAVSPSRVEVPAHGTATATVTTDLDKAGDLQRWTGRLTASAKSVALTRTLLGVSTRQQLFHVRTKVTGRSAEATDGVLTFYRKGDEYAGTYLYGGGQSDELLPPGLYTVYADFRVEGTHGAASAGFARMVIPQVKVTGTTDLVLDGTKLKQVKTVTPKKTENFSRRLDYYREFKDGSSVADTSLIGDGYDSIWTAPTTAPSDGEQYLTARWRNQEPLLSVAAGGQEFDDLWIMPGSAKLSEDDYTLDVIHPGDGLAEDYKGIDAVGKAAVVRWDSDDEDTADDQIRAAQAAGVKLLLFVNDLDGRLREPIIKSSIEVAGLSRTEGDKLIASVDASTTGSLPLRAVSRPDTDYLYDLVRTWKGRIPANPVYAPTTGQLARVETTFRNPTGREVYENRYDIHPWTTYQVGTNRLSTAGAHRTDYVSTDSTFSWTEEGELQSLSYSASGSVTYPAGSTTDVEWFGPVVRPRINGSVQPPVRTGDEVDVIIPSWGDSGGSHANDVAFGSTGAQETSLYRGDTLLAKGGAGVSATVPAKKGVYRLVHTATRTATAAFPYSTDTRTEWTFTSAAPRNGDDSEQLPLVQLDYTLPTSDDGKAAADASLLVTPLHLQGGSNAALNTRKVELSYDDGATWTTARLSGRGNGKVSLPLHAPASAQYLTLRVQAGDSRGNTVTQTVVRAAGIAG